MKDAHETRHARDSHLNQRPNRAALLIGNRRDGGMMASRTARQFFEDARAASQDATLCRNQLIALEERARRLGGPAFEPRVRGTKEPDRMAANVCGYVTREQSLRRRQDADYEVIGRASKVLYGMDEDGTGGLCAHLSAVYADIVYHRYLGDEPWKSVAMAVGYSVRPCQIMCNTAMATIDELDLLGMVSA